MKIIYLQGSNAKIVANGPWKYIVVICPRKTRNVFKLMWDLASNSQ